MAVMNPFPIDSTLTDTSLPTMVFGAIMTRTRRLLSEKGYLPREDSQQLHPSMSSVLLNQRLRSIYLTIAEARLIVAKRIGYPFPILDIANELDLLVPMSIDSLVKLIKQMVTAGLLDYDCSLGIVGLQLISFHAHSPLDAKIRSELYNAMWHRLSVDIFLAVLDKSLQEANNRELTWSGSIQYFYPTRTFGIKDPPGKARDVVGIYARLRNIVRSMMSPKWVPTLAVVDDDFQIEKGMDIILSVIEKIELSDGVGKIDLDESSDEWLTRMLRRIEKNRPIKEEAKVRLL